MSPHRFTTLRRYKISNDVLMLILEKLDAATLFKTCKAFRRVYVLVMEFQPLRYRFELAVAGMKDGPASYTAGSPLARLHLLLAYRKDWPKLHWGPENKLKVPASAPVNVSGGFVYYVGPQTIDLAELPSCRTSRPPSQTHHLRYVTTPQVKVVAVEPSQSLIVTGHTFPGPNGLVGVRLNIRDLWTFGKHARASAAFFDFSTQSTDDVTNISIAICGRKMVASLDFAGAKSKHLLIEWSTLQARWLDEQSVHFLSEDYLLVARKTRDSLTLLLYNISNPMNVTAEREYELPEIWANSVITFGENVAPTTDRSASKDAMFYCDPSARILLVTAKPAMGMHGPAHWLFINESYFRPPSRKNPHTHIPWNQWSQYCLIRDLPPLITANCVVGTRVVYMETAQSSRGHGCRSRLNTIEFAQYPDDSPCAPSRAWSLIGSRSPLFPIESSREVPSDISDGQQLENMCATEDNIILVSAPQHGFKPINILTFGAPSTRPPHQGLHSQQL